LHNIKTRSPVVADIADRTVENSHVSLRNMAIPDVEYLAFHLFTICFNVIRQMGHQYTWFKNKGV